jgi:hypothetical protein
MYTHHEGEGTCGQDVITSVLLDYVKNNLTTDKSELGSFLFFVQDQIKIK